MSAPAQPPADVPASVDARARGRRALAAVLVVVVAGAALAAVVAQATWVHVHLRPGGGGVLSGAPVEVDVRGSDAVPALVPLSLLAMAGAVGLVASRGVLRRVVAVLVAAAGAGVVVLSVQVLADPASVVVPALRAQSLDALGRGSGTTTSWWWPVLAAVGGLGVLGAALLAAVRSGAWPAMGARYDAPAGRDSTGGPPPDAWTALDRGEDPTLGGTSGAAGPPDDLPE